MGTIKTHTVGVVLKDPDYIRLKSVSRMLERPMAQLAREALMKWLREFEKRPKMRS